MKSLIKLSFTPLLAVLISLSSANSYAETLADEAFSDGSLNANSTSEVLEVKKKYNVDDLANAINSGDKAKVEEIINKNIDLVNQLTSNGETPLTMAAKEKQPEIIKVLLSNGADETLLNESKKTALEIAQGLEDKKSIEILKNPSKFKPFWTPAKVGLAIAGVGGAALAAGGGGGGGGGGGSPVPSPMLPESPESNPASNFGTAEENANLGLGSSGAGINAASAYQLGYDGRIWNRNGDGSLVDGTPDGFVTVAVIDSGFDLDHSDLDANFLVAQAVTCTGGSGCIAGVTDFDPHGTNVSGIIAAERNGSGIQGIAPQAKIIPISAIDVADGSTPAAIDYAVNNGAQIINGSYGLNYRGGTSIPIVDAERISGGDVPALNSNDFNNFVMDDVSDGKTLRQEYQQAIQNKTIIVMSNGNSALDEVGIYAGLPYYFNGTVNAYNPDGYDWRGYWVASASVDSSKEISNFSNQCGVARDWCISTLGTNVFTTDSAGGYTTTSGTSFSAPTASGAIAVLLGAFPHLDPAEILSIIFESAEDLGAPGVDDVYGHGLLDLENALNPSNGAWTLTSGNDLSGPSHNFQNTRIISNDILSLPNGFAEKQIMFFDKYNKNYYTTLGNLVSFEQNRIQLFDRYNHFRRNAVNEKINLTDNLSFTLGGNLGENRNRVSFIEGSEFNSFVSKVEYSANNQSSMFASFGSMEGGDLDNVFYFSNARNHNNRFFNKTSHLSLFEQAIISELGYIYNNIGFKTAIIKEHNQDNELHGGFVKTNSDSFYNEIFYKDDENNFSISLINGVLDENNSLLGTEFSGAFNIGDSVKTDYYGVGGSLNITNKIDISGSYFYGIGEDLNNNNLTSLVTGIRNLRSDSFEIAINLQDLVQENSNLRMSFSEPLAVIGGNMNLRLPSSINANGDLYYSDESINLKNEERELNYSFMYDIAGNNEYDEKYSLLGLYRQNPENNAFAEDEVILMFNYKTKFDLPI